MTLHAAVTLAARDPTNSDVWRVVIFIMVAIAIVALGGTAVMWVRRRTMQSGGAEASASSFLDELREQKRRGEISEEEFESLKKKLADSIRRSMKDASPDNPRRNR